MTTGSSVTPGEVLSAKAAQRQQTRTTVLNAVLDIIVSDGMRAVRHRAVAEKAGVALGTTTYHFSSIEDLIVSAFNYWRTRVTLADNPYYTKMVELFKPFEKSGVPKSNRSEVARQIYLISVGYTLDQLTDKRQDRIIELAFYHESTLSTSLRDVMRETWGLELGYLEQVHRLMGSGHPLEDARITFMLFRQLEQSAILTNLNVDVIRKTLHRHMRLCFDVEFSDNFTFADQ